MFLKVALLGLGLFGGGVGLLWAAVLVESYILLASGMLLATGGVLSSTQGSAAA